MREPYSFSTFDPVRVEIMSPGTLKNGRRYNPTYMLLLEEGARAFRRNLDHALRRQAEVDAKADPQEWEVEHAREAVISAQAALVAIAVAIAMPAAT